MNMSKTVGIIGSGPAGLMTAEVLSKAGYSISLFDKRKSPGRKILIAGSSGLNISNALPVAEFISHYSKVAEFPQFWSQLFQNFSTQDWIRSIENLGVETFLGTSGRYFIKDKKASRFLRAWLHRLEENQVKGHFGFECVDFERDPKTHKISLTFSSQIQNSEVQNSFDAVCFCLGGGSYEPNEIPLRWPSLFTHKNLAFVPFTPSNAGYQTKWSTEFLKEAEGLPLKNIQLTSSRGSRKGDLVITNYGLEGTPIYFIGERGRVKIDLKPDLSSEQILKKCQAIKENLSPIRRVKKLLNLNPAALALLFHFTPREISQNLPRLIAFLKDFPLTLTEPQPLAESISAAGGLEIQELDERFMLKKYPGVFVAGEMLNWDAPTGGFLIQGCVSQGYAAAQGILNYLDP